MVPTAKIATTTQILEKRNNLLLSTSFSRALSKMHAQRSKSTRNKKLQQCIRSRQKLLGHIKTINLPELHFPQREKHRYMYLLCFPVIRTRLCEALQPYSLKKRFIHFGTSVKQGHICRTENGGKKQHKLQRLLVQLLNVTFLMPKMLREFFIQSNLRHMNKKDLNSRNFSREIFLPLPDSIPRTATSLQCLRGQWAGLLHVSHTSQIPPQQNGRPYRTQATSVADGCFFSSLSKPLPFKANTT